MAVFSIRHRRGLEAEDLVIVLDPRVRGRLQRLFNRFDESYQTTDNSGFSSYTSTSGETESQLKDVYGSNSLPSHKGHGLDGLLSSGIGAHVFDALELYRGEVPHGDAFSAQLNTILREQESGWQMLDGEMVLLDRSFAQELAERSTRSLAAAGYEGAMQELRDAHNDVVDGDYRGAIHNAGNSQESVMKALLSRDDGSAKKLAQELNRAGHFDGLPKALRENFVREVLQPLPWMRNNLGGHGQGEKAVDMPRQYAQLAVDLASSYVHFLISLRTDGTSADMGTGVSSEASSFTPAFDLPVDDDIPF